VSNAAHVFLTIGFLAIISSAGLIQTAAELRRGERPQALELFRQVPTEKNLRAFESNLQDASIVAKVLRPWAQYARFAWLADAGEKAIVGREGWLFFRPGVEYITQRPPVPPPEDTSQDPLTAIASFRDQLAARGIRLLVVPVPNKESTYPERISRRAQGAGVIASRQTRQLLQQLESAGVEVVDLFEEFRRARQDGAYSNPHELYLAHDTHWSPKGVRLAAEATARRLVERGWVALGIARYEERSVEIQRLGDLIEMLQSSQLERIIAPQRLACPRVVRRESASPYRDAPDAQVLVLGDSFLRIYEQDEPGSAGFVANLARQLEQPLASIISDGGASTLVRQELCRRPGLLKNKQVVIWEFVERDIRLGTEGWQVVPLPQASDEPRKAGAEGDRSHVPTND
jgi:lysophospholipase L1-like esterase